MRVALDVDDVLADFMGASLHWARARYGVKVTREDIVDWNMEQFLPEHAQAPLMELWKSENFCLTLPLVREQVPIEDVVRALRSLHKVRCLTAPKDTSIHWKGERVAWLKNIFDFDYQDVLFEKRKFEHVTDFDVLIDDAAHNIVAWEDHGGTGILIDRPWNQHINHPRRMKSLFDAFLSLEHT